MKIKRLTSKENVMLAWIMSMAGVVLVFCDFFINRQVSGGVLAALGELLTFSGCLLGIGQYMKNKYQRKDEETA